MSASPATAVRRQSTSVTAGPNLRLAPAPQRRYGRALYLTFCLAVLLGALVAVLAFNTAMAKGAFEIYQLERDVADLESEATKKEEQLADKTTPEQLAELAAKLGMVPPANTNYILLQSGQVIGSVTPDQSSDQDPTDQCDPVAGQGDPVVDQGDQAADLDQPGQDFPADLP
ncbi:MAG: hypothetical protein FWG16_06675 [Micrococcales bacterium]|nr:hypothetical protein [Micrococcales bacterium]